MQHDQNGPSSVFRWQTRVMLWRQHGTGIAAALGALSQWFMLREVFAVADVRAFWKIALGNAAVVVFLVVRAYIRVERTMRAIYGLGSAPVAQTTPYRTASACVDGTCPPPPCGDMVRREVVAPFVGAETIGLNAEMDARRTALAPLNTEELRLMRAVFASRCFEVGVLVPRDASPKDAPPTA